MDWSQPDKNPILQKPIWLLDQNVCTTFGVRPPEHRWFDDKYEKFWFLRPHEVQEICTFRETGGSKPNYISWGDWLGGVKEHPHRSGLNQRRRLACLYHVAGVKNCHIARRIGMTESKVSILLSSSACRWHCYLLRKRFSNFQHWFHPSKISNYLLLQRMAGWRVKIEELNTELWQANQRNWYQLALDISKGEKIKVQII